MSLKIPLCDLAAGYRLIEGEVMTSLRELLSTQQLILGKNVKALEDSIAEFCATKH